MIKGLDVDMFLDDRFYCKHTCLFFRILIYYDGVEMGFDMPGSLPHFKGNKKGRVYLTTHRVRSIID